jgi:hypothetical protein
MAQDARIGDTYSAAEVGSGSIEAEHALEVSEQPTRILGKLPQYPATTLVCRTKALRERLGKQ